MSVFEFLRYGDATCMCLLQGCILAKISGNFCNPRQALFGTSVYKLLLGQKNIGHVPGGTLRYRNDVCSVGPSAMSTAHFVHVATTDGADRGRTTNPPTDRPAIVLRSRVGIKESRRKGGERLLLNWIMQTTLWLLVVTISANWILLGSHEPLLFD